MIEYDYEIKRDEGIETRTFRPKLPTKLDNISYIEGPNSYGKSTLLHILALAFYGDQKELHVALLNKMNKLLKSSHQRLIFKVIISNSDGSLQLISEKKDPNKPGIIVRELVSGKSTPLSPKTFENKYNLIYDIPANPTERLKELANEIKDEQVKYGNHLSSLRESISSTISDIQNSRDPNKIKKLERELEGFKKAEGQFASEIERLKVDCDLLKKAVYYRYYNLYKKIRDQKLEKIDEISKTLKSVERRRKKSIGQSSSLRDDLKLELNELDDRFIKIIGVLKAVFHKGQEHHFRILDRMDIFETADSLEFDKNLKCEIEDFERLLEELEAKKDSETAVQEVRLYSELIEVLERYKNSNLTIPGLKKTVSEFIVELKQLSEKKTGVKALLENIADAKKLLGEFELKMDDLERGLLHGLKELKETEEGIDEDLDEKDTEELDRLRDELEKVAKRLEFYDQRYAVIGRPHRSQIFEIGSGPLRDYSGYTEDQLLKSIDRFESDIKTNNEERERKKRHIRFNDEEIEKLKKKEPHIYQDYFEELNELLNAVTALESKVRRDFDEYIKNIIQKQDAKATKEQEKYNHAVFKYLGNKIGFIRHLNEEYQVDKIDLIEEKILTKEGRTIHLADMGTGQSQSAYLKGKLEISDDRKIIALFDEVAMMDQKSLEPIYDKFCELYRKGRLLVGLVVQKAETPKVISKIKE